MVGCVTWPQKNDSSNVHPTQVELLESRRSEDATESEGLRRALADLQSRSDPAAAAGRLHRQVVDLQVREKELARRLRASESCRARQEARAFRLGRRAEELEGRCARVRAAAQVRVSALREAVRDLRRQYAGSVPLARMERAARESRRAAEGRAAAARALRDAEEKAAEAARRAEELQVKQEGEIWWGWGWGWGEGGGSQRRRRRRTRRRIHLEVTF